MPIRQKLYYNLTIVGGAADGGFGAFNPTAIRVCAGTGPNFGATNPALAGSDLDRYGNVLARNQFNGLQAGVSTDQARKCRKAISAWFQVSGYVPVGNGGNVPKIFVDFIRETGATNQAAMTDPGLDARPRVRISGFSTSAQITGTLYVQRQHSFEV